MRRDEEVVYSGPGSDLRKDPKDRGKDRIPQGSHDAGRDRIAHIFRWLGRNTEKVKTISEGRLVIDFAGPDVAFHLEEI